MHKGQVRHTPSINFFCRTIARFFMIYELEKVALRYGALYLPGKSCDRLTPEAAALATLLGTHGFGLEESTLHALNGLSAADAKGLADVIKDIYGDDLNWSSLINNWLAPTGEKWESRILAAIANTLCSNEVEGTVLPCGHNIPNGLFDLSRYNGCPLCGTPFKVAQGTFTGQGGERTLLKRFTDEDMLRLFESIAASPAPPDATQRDSLMLLAAYYELQDGFAVGNIESAIAISAGSFKGEDYASAFGLLDSPLMLMRMLWFLRTGNIRIVRPAVIKKKTDCDLHYSRKECRAVAEWLNSIVNDTEGACEALHPFRGMWVRFIRALRLSEYARHPQYTHLAAFLDCFYNKSYPVWAGALQEALLAGDAEKYTAMLRERPGTFARSLFAAMLHFGDAAADGFRAIAGKVAPRLLVTLDSYSADYFLGDGDRRVVVLADGRRVEVPVNQNLKELSAEQRAEYAHTVKEIALQTLMKHYRDKYGASEQTIYIAPGLFDIPVPVGDRGNAVQDASAALTGQIFPVSGDAVRLFLQWGEGLDAQHLDMDLSAKILYGNGITTDCAYYSLCVPGAVHSGDIQYIPDKVGTAEYIELNLPDLQASGARYVVFACNAYSTMQLAPNLRVGWMDCSQPMKVDAKTGVAYDPSTVSQMVHITAGDLSRGLVFGVLDVEKRDITWLEIPNDTRFMAQLKASLVEAYLRRLHSKISIGELLEVYAAARGMTIVPSVEADFSYTVRWATDTVAVADLLL